MLSNGGQMKSFLLQLLTCLLTSGAFALETGELTDDRAVALLEKNCIQTATGGVMPAPFGAVVDYLNAPALLQRIQDEYLRSVSRDGIIDYPIVETGEGTYYYINEKNQRTDVVELYRGQTSGSSYDLAYYAKGKRFFGRYELLVHIRVFDAGPVGTLYTVSVYVYPRNGPVRFLTRHLGTVERYFRRKTWILVRVTEKICRGLNDPLPLIYPSPISALLPEPQTWEDRAPQNDSTQPACSDSAGPRRHT